MPEEHETSSEEPLPDQDAPSPHTGRYVIEGSVGKGGMGQVYRARDQHLGRLVAIKRISNDAGVDEAIRREAGILAALHHPNIVTIFDFAADEAGPFVVMELVEGSTLDQIVAHRPFDVPSFLELVNQVCRGLSSAHAAGLLHLDLKSGNIMMQAHQDGSFTAKILDFGLARAREESFDPVAGEIYASPYTVPPEQLSRQPLDVRSDIYSLGCVFYYALSGKHPFDAPAVADVLRRHMEGVTTPLHLIAPRVPRAMSEVIARMIHLDPNARPQSVEQARSALHKASRAPAPGFNTLAAAHRPPVVQRPPAVRPGVTYHAPPAAAKSSGGSLGWIVALVVLAAAGGAWWMYNQNNPGAGRGNPPASLSDTAAAPSQPAIPQLDLADAASFASHIDEAVMVEGAVASVEESSLFHAVFLRFKGVPSNGAVVSVPENVMALGQLQALAGKRLRVTGKCSQAAAMTRVSVAAASDIQEIP